MIIFVAVLARVSGENLPCRGATHFHHKLFPGPSSRWAGSPNSVVAPNVQCSGGIAPPVYQMLNDGPFNRAASLKLSLSQGTSGRSSMVKSTDVSPFATPPI